MAGPGSTARPGPPPISTCMCSPATSTWGIGAIPPGCPPSWPTASGCGRGRRWVGRWRGRARAWCPWGFSTEGGPLLPGARRWGGGLRLPLGGIVEGAEAVEIPGEDLPEGDEQGGDQGPDHKAVDAEQHQPAEGGEQHQPVRQLGVAAHQDGAQDIEIGRASCRKRGRARRGGEAGYGRRARRGGG